MKILYAAGLVLLPMW